MTVTTSTKRQTVVWKDKYGNSYSYSIFPLPVSLNPGQAGNYIFCKLVNQTWVPIYIGQGDLKERTSNSHKKNCIVSKGATHVHCHLNNSEASRLLEESNLLATFPQAYAPTGCNERTGG